MILGGKYSAHSRAPRTFLRKAGIVAAFLLWMTALVGAQEEQLPGREVARRILVLYGYDPRVGEKPQMFPIDTLTASALQSHLEWLGYDLDYFDAGVAAPPQVGPETAAIIIDGTLHVPVEREVPLADWMNNQRLKQVPILILGDIPFRDEVATKRWQRDFGVGGDLEPVRHLKTLDITQVDKTFFSSEVPLTARQQDFVRLIAPEGSEILLSLSGKDEVGGVYRYDPVFKANWGVALLTPYLTFNASGTQRFYYVEPYALISRWLGGRVFPVPDVTTRMGRRLFYSHIDGDGFAMKSARTGQPTCAEIVRDNILQKYPFPVTVSVVESDIRGLAQNLKPADAPKYEAIARSIFALPHVEAASHSYSHPFWWDDADPNPGEYPSRFVPLLPEAKYDKLDLVKEIAGSVKFINERLLPPGKKAELMLWSGNCRPGVEALRITRELGLENMNGGDTTVSTLYPSLVNVAPRLMQWGDEIQVYAANQNEFMYAGGFSGPFYGGFAKVVDTFERTESPRRLKPVNVYYHFYSGITISAERALKKILDWCWAQPLHHITATEYARLVKDAHRATVRELEPGKWLLRSGAHLQTWRLPAAAGIPDMHSCSGVLGFKMEKDQLYVHTNGQPEVILKMAPNAPGLRMQHLFVSEASGALDVTEFSNATMIFSNKGTLPVRVVVGGAEPDGSTELILSGNGRSEKQLISTDRQGLISFIVMEGKTASLKTDRPVAAQ